MTDAIAHDHAEVRRCTSVIRVFPNQASFLHLASALAAERKDRWLARPYVGVVSASRPAGEVADTA